MQEKNKGWNTVKEDERYIVTDNSLLKNLVASATYLNPDKSTSGHKHPGQEEVYIFMTGTGQMEIDDRNFDVKPGDVVLIEDGEFHRVHNDGKEILEFVCVFDGKRSH